MQGVDRVRRGRDPGLPGNIGTNDVADCMAALDAAIAEGAGIAPHSNYRQRMLS